MPYTTPKAVVDSGLTRYSLQYIHILARKGKIPAYRVGASIILAPEGVECLLQREQESRKGRLRAGGLKPGQQIARAKYPS